jgi:hypothetical protein
MSNSMKFKHGTSAALISFDLENRESTLQLQVGDQRIALNAWEAEDFVSWLARHKDELHWLAHREEEEELDEDEIYPY